MAMQVLERDANGREMKFSIIRPDNWHAHVRAGTKMKAVVAAIAAVYGRATVMPNTQPIMTVAQAINYRDEIVNTLLEQGFSWERARIFPQMTLYLHQELTNDKIRRAKEFGIIGIKFYPKNPKHGTIGSQAGVSSLDDVRSQLESMCKYGMPLLLHGESAFHSQIIDLERYFVTDQLAPTVERYPELPIVLEHVSTKEGVRFVLDAPPRVTATVTPQHLMYDINSIFEGGLRSHRYCLPIYKHPEDQEALIQAVTDKNNTKFAAGDDSAPHPEHGPKGKAKLADCGCAGAYVAPVSVPLYVAAFEKAGALDDRFEAFMSRNGAKARGLPQNKDEIIIARKPWIVPANFDYADGDTVVPLCAGEELEWQVVQN